MALDHLQPGQVVDLQPLGDQLGTQKSIALFKSADLELLRLVLPTGASMPTHSVPGEITILCIEGAIEVKTPHASQVLRAGQLLYLLGGAPHSVTALENASALVTITVRK